MDVNAPSRFGSVLRWYPAAWRARYGDELTALLEDTYGDRRLPIGVRLSLVRAGSVERLRVSPLAGRGGPSGRVRSGALVVLCAWTLVVVAGATFAKTAEHWDRAVPRADRAVPAAGYAAVEWAAMAGLVTVALAAACCLPSFTRFLRGGGWPAIRRAVAGASAVTALTLAAGWAMVTWAHHLDPAQRNGGSWPYGLAAVGGALLVVATLAGWTGAAVVVVGRLDLPGRVLRTCGALALVLTATMTVVLGGTLTWWSSVGLHAPGFLGWTVGPVGTAVSAPLVVAGVLMVGALALAVGASWRIGRHLARIAD